MEGIANQQFIDFVPYVTVPLLAATVLGFVLFITKRAEKLRRIEPHEARAVQQLVAAWALWGLASAGLSLSGAYASDSFYAMLPGLWITFVPVFMFIAFSVASPTIRDGIGKVLAATPLHWLVYFQALRLSAIRTAFETARGTFPQSFELAVGVPDLLFGLSALYVGKRTSEGSISKRAVGWWSLAGALVIVPSAPLVAQMGLAGPLQFFTAEPSAAVLFVYPMVLAPTLIVPLFVLFNLLTAQHLLGRERVTQAERFTSTAARLYPRSLSRVVR